MEERGGRAERETQRRKRKMGVCCGEHPGDSSGGKHMGPGGMGEMVTELFRTGAWLSS